MAAVKNTAEGVTVKEELSEECEPCKFANYIHPAVGWCETCDELLCTDCLETHHRSKSFRNHHLCSITEMKICQQRMRVSNTCEKHGGKHLEYFCEDHAELGCSQCFVTKHRPCKKVICIAEVKTRESEEFKALVKLLSDLDTRLKVNEDSTERNVSLTETQHVKALANIEEFGDKLKTFIDVLVKRQIDTIERIKADNIRHLTEMDEAFNDISMKIKTYNELLAAEKEDTIQLFLTTKHLEHEAKLLLSKLREHEQKKVIEYEFVLNPELTSVLENVTDFGTLSDLQLLNQEMATDEFVEEVKVMRFLSTFYGWKYEGYEDAIGMTTDHDIELLDVLLYPCLQGDTKVELTISNGFNFLVNCYSTHKNTGTDVIDVKVTNERGGRGVTLQAGHQYDVAVKIDGSASLCGDDGQTDVIAEGVTFSFSEIDSPGGTGVNRGQIAGFRFIRL